MSHVHGPSPTSEQDPSNAPIALDPPNKADDLGFTLPEPARLTRGRVVLLVSLGVAVLGGAFAIGFVPRWRARQALQRETTSAGASIPRVQVLRPAQSSSDRALSLPGTVQALEETILYPRASGYLRKWYVDLGDKVKEGDLLAEIDTPEIDQQVAQARAQLAQAEAALLQSKATEHFSTQNLDRRQKLVPEGVLSQEDLEKTKSQAEVDTASVTVASANVAAMRANMERLNQLKSFARVVAPFSGTITARTVDRGALVTQGNSTPLFKLSSTDPVRVFVQAPQDVAPSVQVNTAATVKVREFPDRSFTGTVARSAGALDPTTRTMTTEVRVPNPKGELLTGMYAQVSLTLPMPHHVFELPATALLNDAKGLRVAVVGEDDRIHLVPVVVERDTGPTIEIASGLDGSERVVTVPSAELTDGRQVEITK